MVKYFISPTILFLSHSYFYSSCSLFRLSFNFLDSAMDQRRYSLKGLRIWRQSRHVIPTGPYCVSHCQSAGGLRSVITISAPPSHEHSSTFCTLHTGVITLTTQTWTEHCLLEVCWIHPSFVWQIDLETKPHHLLPYTAPPSLLTPKAESKITSHPFLISILLWLLPCSE